MTITTDALRRAVLANLADEGRTSRELAGRAIGDTTRIAVVRVGQAAASLAARGLAVRTPCGAVKHDAWQLTEAGKAALERLTGKASTP